MYKIYDYRNNRVPVYRRKDKKLMKFILSHLYESFSPEIEEKVLSLINTKININTFLLSLVYYKRLIDKSEPYWSWVGVLILSDCYLNDESYTNNAWEGVLNRTIEEIKEAYETVTKVTSKLDKAGLGN